MNKFSDVKIGDKLERDMCGLKMPVKVEKVEDGIIHCAGGWMFRTDNGAEYDPDLGWDGIYVIGSTLTGVWSE